MNFIAHIWSANLAWFQSPLFWILLVPIYMTAYWLTPKGYTGLVHSARIFRKWIPYIFFLIVIEIFSCYQVFVVYW